MSQMDFERRAQVSGKAGARTQLATVRGNIRRTDADGFSAVPYFEGLSIGDTLSVDLDGVTFTTTVTGVSFNQVVIDLNTEFGAAGVAFDSDGCIGIRTSTLGGEGSVEVTGGTGAEFLGFDTTFGEVFKAHGGDIASSPEGRIGNQFGSSLPLPRTNLTVDTVNNALSKVAGNIDVLFSDLMRGDVKLKKVSSFTIDGTRTKITPPGITRVYTGGTVGSPLTSSSPPEILGAYFILIDTVTKQLAPSRVIGVQYLGVNILGVGRAKTSNSITNIKNGRVVEITGSIVGVAVGDFATISSATNLSPWSNNGYRWVVEEILDSTHIALRPMSKIELVMIGSSVDDSQPILELNDKIATLESFGTVNFSSGVASTDVDLIVSPAIPLGASYELWVAQPQSLRESRSDSVHDSLNPLSRHLFSILDFLPNGLLSHPTITIDATNISWTAFYVRRHNRVFLLPAASITRPVASALITFVYWEPASNKIKTTTSGLGTITGSATSLAPNQSETSLDGVVLCSFLNDGTASPTIIKADSLASDYTDTGRITVGWGGQFLNLQSAVGYLNALAKASGENASQVVTNNVSHHEIILLDSQTVSSPILIQAPGIIIRGANPQVQLIINGSPANIFTIGSGGEFVLRDLVIQNAAAISNIDLIVDAVGISTPFKIIIQNVRTNGGTQPFRTIYRAAQSTTVSRLDIADCELILGGGIAWGPLSNAYVKDSLIAYFPITGIDGNLIFSNNNNGAVAGDVSTINFLRLENCQFLEWATNGADGVPLLLYDGGIGHILITGCTFTFGAGLGATVTFIRASSPTIVINSSMIGSASRGIFEVIDSGISSTIDDCLIYVPAGQERDGIKCGRIDNTRIFANNIDLSTGTRYLHEVPTGTAAFTDMIEVGEFADPGVALQRARSRMYRDRSGTLWITHNARLNKSLNKWEADDTSLNAVAVRFGVGSNGRYIAPYSGGLPIPMATLLVTYQPFVTPEQDTIWTGSNIFQAQTIHNDGILVNTPTTPNRHGISTVGTGTGSGIDAVGGASAPGISATGGGAGAPGITSLGIGSGSGIYGAGGTSNGAGVEGQGGATNGNGVKGTGAGSGHGGEFQGGSSGGRGVFCTSGTNGSAVRAIGGEGNSLGIDATNNGSGSTIFAEAIGSGIGVEIDATAGTGKALDATGNSSSDTASFVGGSGRRAATFAGGAGGDAALFTGGSSTGKGIVSSGGGTGVGGQFSNGTAATGSTPQNAVVLANGNLSLAGAEPNATVGFTDTVTPMNVVKAWAYINSDGAGNVSITDGFNVTSVSVSTQTITLTIQNDMADLHFGVVFGGGSAQLGGGVIFPYEKGNVRAAGLVKIGAFAFSGGSTAGVVDFSADATDFSVWIIGRQ